MRFACLLATLLAAGAALAQAPAREVVPLDPSEREHVLAEMRGFLGMLEKVSGALARGDFDAVAGAVRALGEGEGKNRMPPAIAKKLPPTFRTMARSVHDQIDAVGADAARRDSRHTLEQVSRLLATCNSCHATYRFPN